MQSPAAIWRANRCIWRAISILVDQCRALLAVVRRAQSAIFLFISFLFPSTRCAHHACSNLMYSCFHSNIHALRVFLVCISWIRVGYSSTYKKEHACNTAHSRTSHRWLARSNFGRSRRPHFATCADSSNLLTISSGCQWLAAEPPAERGACALGE